MSSSKNPPTSSSGPDQSRNEYIPSFISKRPFWAEGISSSDADYLEHQRLQSTPKDTLDKAKWYDRGKKVGAAATKFRKGACENCGAMTHKTKDCLSRPRKHGAKWTGRDIQADEVVEDVKLGWDAKRDRWNGYDNREYISVVKEYEELEGLKKQAAGATASKAVDNGPEDLSDARYGEETDMGRSQPTSTRQLRLREDTAKYLLNLDLDSAKYDPKTRSMDTSGQAADGADADEGFVRPSNDAAEFERAQSYAWETQESRNPATKKLHLQANPTEGEILRKKQIDEASTKRATARQALLDKYGDATASDVATKPKVKPAHLIASERYVEYDASGQVKGETRAVPRSKYAEDVLTNNHTSVWGSWWKSFVWGYACCHSTVKNSYCTGAAGRQAFEEADNMRTGEALLALKQTGEDVEAEAETDVREAQRGDWESREAGVQDSQSHPAKKRTLAELQSGMSEEVLESYKRSRMAADDPMANFLGKDEPVP